MRSRILRRKTASSSAGRIMPIRIDQSAILGEANEHELVDLLFVIDHDSRRAALASEIAHAVAKVAVDLRNNAGVTITEASVMAMVDLDALVNFAHDLRLGRRTKQAVDRMLNQVNGWAVHTALGNQQFERVARREFAEASKFIQLRGAEVVEFSQVKANANAGGSAMPAIDVSKPVEMFLDERGVQTDMGQEASDVSRNGYVLAAV